MKSNKGLRASSDVFGPEDLLRKAAKLEPIKKSGKEKRAFIRELDDDDDFDLKQLHKKESVLDYFDDGSEVDDGVDNEDEWEEMDEDDADDLNEDWEEDWTEDSDAGTDRAVD